MKKLQILNGYMQSIVSLNLLSNCRPENAVSRHKKGRIHRSRFTPRSCDLNRVSQVFRLADSCVLLEVHHVLIWLRNLWYIAETCNSAVRVENVLWVIAIHKFFQRIYTTAYSAMVPQYNILIIPF